MWAKAEQDPTPRARQRAGAWVSGWRGASLHSFAFVLLGNVPGVGVGVGGVRGASLVFYKSHVQLQLLFLPAGYELQGVPEGLGEIFWLEVGAGNLGQRP